MILKPFENLELYGSKYRNGMCSIKLITYYCLNPSKISFQSPRSIVQFSRSMIRSNYEDTKEKSTRHRDTILPTGQLYCQTVLLNLKLPSATHDTIIDELLGVPFRSLPPVNILKDYPPSPSFIFQSLKFNAEFLARKVEIRHRVYFLFEIEYVYMYVYMYIEYSRREHGFLWLHVY